MKKKILVFEGIDGCGKTSVIHEIKNILDEKSVKCDVLTTPHMIFNIRELLKKSTADKYIEKNGKDNYNSLIKDLMYVDKIASVVPGGLLYEKVMNSDTEIILLDRFTYSYLVYNCKDTMMNEMMDFHINMRGIYDATDYYNIYLYLDPKIANKKIDERGEEREATELDDQTSLVDKFNKLFRYDKIIKTDSDVQIYSSIYRIYPCIYSDSFSDYFANVIYFQYHDGERDTPKKIAENLLSYILNNKQ